MKVRRIAVSMIVEIGDGAFVRAGHAVAVGIGETIEQIAQTVRRDLSGDGGTAAEAAAGTLTVHAAHAALAQRVAAAVADLGLGIHVRDFSRMAPAATGGQRCVGTSVCAADNA